VGDSFDTDEGGVSFFQRAAFYLGTRGIFPVQEPDRQVDVMLPEGDKQIPYSRKKGIIPDAGILKLYNQSVKIGKLVLMSAEGIFTGTIKGNKLAVSQTQAFIDFSFVQFFLILKFSEKPMLRHKDTSQVSPFAEGLKKVFPCLCMPGGLITYNSHPALLKRRIRIVPQGDCAKLNHNFSLIS
jgi:hypothetical protein